MNHEAAARNAAGRYDQMLAGEKAQRLAYRRAAQPGPRAHLRFGRQPVARTKDASGDLRTQLLGELLVRRKPLCLADTHKATAYCLRPSSIAPQVLSLRRVRGVKRPRPARARSWVPR